ncbi:fatty acyl-CoA hydrolase precursor, medium chain-like [Ciona intestinalis]
MPAGRIISLPNYGKVKCGNITRAESSVEVENFFGIPFAKPPIGKLRFTAPQRAEPWSGILCEKRVEKIPLQSVGMLNFATNFRISKDTFLQENASEDCLYLSVYAPSIKKSHPLPVMVWFYGGSFQMGPSMKYDGTALAAMNEVIVVVPNYRVGIFGFLSLGHETECKGNMGLLDQLESLKWVEENIEYFGGEKNNVTICGESAGGISVHMHMMSPLSAGYFHKAISHSGTTNMTRIYYKDQQRIVTQLLESLNIKETNPSSVLSQLQNLPADQLVEYNTVQSRFCWYPTFDNHFFKTSPEIMATVAKVPFLLGCNSDDGGWLMAVEIPNFMSGFSKQEFIRFSRILLRKYDKTIDCDKALPVLIMRYSRGLNVKDKMYYSNLYGRMLTDCVFINRIVPASQEHSGKYILNECNLFIILCIRAIAVKCFAERKIHTGGDTFLYLMSHPPLHKHDASYGPLSGELPIHIGADHADDIPFTFGFPFLPAVLKSGYRFSADEEKLSKKMMTFLTNFAKTGNPNKPVPLEVDWPLYNSESRKHVEFTLPSIKLGFNLGQDKLHLYNKKLAKL